MTLQSKNRMVTKIPEIRATPEYPRHLEAKRSSGALTKVDLNAEKQNRANKSAPLLIVVHHIAGLYAMYL